MNLHPIAVTVDNQLETTDHSAQCGQWGAMSCSHGNMPLKALSAKIRVQRLTCHTVIRQVFVNTHPQPIEATYIFPLPGRHAVVGCEMSIHGRVVQAVLKERGEAREAYQQAIAEGRRAALAEEDRSETFTLTAGNVMPGEEIAVELTLVGLVTVVDNEACLRLPLVIAPRYTPGRPLSGRSSGSGVGLDTDQAPDASRISPPTWLPGVPNPVQLNVEATLALGPFAEKDWQSKIRSSLHATSMQNDPSDATSCVVRLLPGERLNRDFILRFPVLQKHANVTAVSSGNAQSSKAASLTTVAIHICPPVSSHRMKAKDVCIVLDRSGSMSGWKMVAARRAAGRMIDSLDDGDRFRLFAFDNVIETPSPMWQHATDSQRWEATQWLANIESRGGTELGSALLEAGQAFDGEAQPIIVLVTDGQVSNEDSILRGLASLSLPSPPRIYSVGIDRAVNAGLLQRLARWGQGGFELVESEPQLDAVMHRFHQQLGEPALSNLRVTPLFDGWTDVTPARLTDVFANRPVSVYGRTTVADTSELQFCIEGELPNGEPWSQVVTTEPLGAPTMQPDVPLALWGRSRIRDLEDQYAARPNDQLKSRIIETSLASGVLSRFTAFLAADEEVVNRHGYAHPMTQPVEAPSGWTSVSASMSLEFVASRPPAWLKKQKATREMAPPPEDDFLSADSMLTEFTDTAIDFTETENDLESRPADSVAARIISMIFDEVRVLRVSHVAISFARPIEVQYAHDGDVTLRDQIPDRLRHSLAAQLAEMSGVSLQHLPTPGLASGVISGPLPCRIYFLHCADGMLRIILRVMEQPHAWQEDPPADVSQWLKAARDCCTGDASGAYAETLAQFEADCGSPLTGGLSPDRSASESPGMPRRTTP